MTQKFSWFSKSGILKFLLPFKYLKNNFVDFIIVPVNDIREACQKKQTVEIVNLALFPFGPPLPP